MSELELKFQIPDHVLASLRAELRRRRARSVPMQARYFDTPDGALARHGVSLRLRCEGGRWVQTLKAAGKNLVERLEHNVPLGVRGKTPPPLDLARHEGTEAGAVLRKALENVDAATLVERYRTDFIRSLVRLRLRGAVIEAALDEGSIGAADRTIPIRELELEHKSGSVQALFEIATVWRAYGGLWLDTRSKAARGARLARGASYGDPVKARMPVLLDTMDGTQLVRTVVRSTLDQVLANASEIAAGSTGEGHIHQVRVGMRRLRTALRELGDLDRAIDPAWEPSLAQVFGRLGEVRDNVTAARAVRPLLEKAGAHKLAWDAPAVVVDPVAIVRGPQFQATLLDLLAFALGDGHAGLAPPQVRGFLRKRLARLHRRIVRAGREFESLPLARQHRARKRLKRLRYLAEFVAPLWDAKAAQHYLSHLEPAQDALGEHMDIVVALEKFRASGADDADTQFALRHLEGCLAGSARHAHKALQDVARAEPFWET